MKTVSLSIALCLATWTVQAQTTIVRDPQIAQLVSELSADSLRDHVTKLVSFGTRHTLSTTTDTKRGIGAARQWTLSKFQ